MTTIAVGAPKNPKGTVKGYFYVLPITEDPPENGYEALPAGAVDVGYVSSDGVTLTSNLETEMTQDWNLDDVLQLKQGASAEVSVGVFGWGKEQATVLYGADSVATTTNGFSVSWAGELPEHVWLIAELRGVNGDARLVAEVQLQQPGDAQFVTSAALTHSVAFTAFKNAELLDAKGRPSYWRIYDETAPTP